MKSTLIFLCSLINFILLGQSSVSSKAITERFETSRDPQYGDTMGIGKLLQKLTIPDSVKNGLIPGAVRMDLQIDTNGNIIGQKVSSLCFECKKEALKLLKLMPKFIPAIKDGKKINASYNFTFRFDSAPESTFVYKPEYLEGLWTIQTEGKLHCPECPSIIFYKNQIAKLISDTLNWEMKNRTLTFTNKSKPKTQNFFLNNTYSIVFSKYYKVLTIENGREKYILYKH